MYVIVYITIITIIRLLQANLWGQINILVESLCVRCRSEL